MRRMLSALALVAAAAGSLAAQGDWGRTRLLQVVSHDGREDVRLIDPPATGALYAEGLAERTLTLAPGTYVAVAACDSACADLDLRVVDEAGRTAGEDVDPNPYALADLEVASAGSYRLRVTMVACGAEPCRYAVGVFRVEP